MATPKIGTCVNCQTRIWAEDTAGRRRLRCESCEQKIAEFNRQAALCRAAPKPDYITGPCSICKKPWRRVAEVRQTACHTCTLAQLDRAARLIDGAMQNPNE